MTYVTCPTCYEADRDGEIEVLVGQDSAGADEMSFSFYTAEIEVPCTNGCKLTAKEEAAVLDKAVEQALYGGE